MNFNHASSINIIEVFFFYLYLWTAVPLRNPPMWSKLCPSISTRHASHSPSGKLASCLKVTPSKVASTDLNDRLRGESRFDVGKE